MIKLRRDFSNASKQKLLNIVADVEKEKISSFTDWIGDSYYNFQSWIGKLNIRNYMNDVDSYHRKVIDKNNASKKTIESIFKNVTSVDLIYQGKLSTIKTNLKKWDKYIVQMENTINPGNGNFTATYIENTFKKVKTVQLLSDVITPTTSPGKITTLLQKIINALNNNGMTSSGNSLSNTLKKYLELDEKILKNGSTVLNKFGKKSKANDASLASSVMSYLSSLCGCATKDTTAVSDVVSNFTALFKASGDMELGLYKYYEKKLSIFEFGNLDKKFGKIMTGVTIATKLASAVDEGVNTYKIFTDKDSSAFDKGSQAIEMAGSVFDFGGASYTAALASKKYLRYVDSISGSKKAVNQILVDTRELKYTTSAEATKKIAKVSTIVSLADVAVSTVASGVKRYGQVSKDGTLDMGDWGSVGIYGTFSGINKVSSTLSFGIVHFDSDQVSGEIERNASDFLKSDSWAAKEIKKQVEQGHWYNNVAAFGLATGEAAVLVGTKTVQDVGNGVEKSVETVGNWVSTGWDYVATNWLGF